MERSASLRAHKSLPRPRAATDPPKEKESPGRASVTESISSWIDSASPTLSNPNQHLPLTPPALPQDNLPKEEDPIPEVLEESRTVDNATPVVHMSPLTPDLTPPRKRARDANLSPPPTLRFPSSTSAADSFKTAREFVESVDSLKRFSSPESDISTVIPDGTGRDASLAHAANELSIYARNIGLGLELDMRHDDELAVAPDPLQSVYQSVVEDPLIAKETAAVQQAQRVKNEPQPTIVEDRVKVDDLPQRTDSFSKTRDASLLLKHRIVSDRLESHRRTSATAAMAEGELRKSTELATLLLEKSESQRQTQEPLTIEIKTETIVQVEEESPIDPSITVVDQQTPLKVNRTRKGKNRVPSDSVDLDIKRLSHASIDSGNLIEAIVISPPRRNRHKLRRSSKNHCLRDASSSTHDSKRSSSNSTDHQHVLRHKPAILAEKPNRISMNSDSGISMGNEAPTGNANDIMASDVPQRRSSLRKSHKRIPSSTGEQEKRKSRPVTAPERLMSPTGEIMSQMHPIFDIRPHSHRRSSESRGREVRHALPVIIPPRSSSLSASTSHNTSRAASMVSEPRKSHEQPRRPSNQHRSSSPHVRISLPKNDEKETPTEGFLDPFRSDGEASPVLSPYLRSSLTRTPFSAISTPGPVEYGQGTTMSIFPHHNESVLMVQHTHRPESQDGPVTPTRTAARPVPVERGRLATPPQTRRRNISATSTSFSSPTKAFRPNKPFNIARTPSGRRHSDSHIMPLSRLAEAAKNTSPRQRVRVNDESNALAPFWRPSGFWNDLSDSEDEDSVNNDQMPVAEKVFVVRNTLGLPQTPVVNGPVGLAKRLGSFRRRKQTQTSERRSSMPIPDTVSYPTPPKSVKITRHGRSFSLTSITHLYDSFQQKRVAKTEAKYEQRREKLKKSIGPAVLRDNAKNF